MAWLTDPSLPVVLSHPLGGGSLAGCVCLCMTVLLASPMVGTWQGFGANCPGQSDGFISGNDGGHTKVLLGDT